MSPDSEWVIQLVVRPRADEHHSELRELPWAGYARPMTRDQAIDGNETRFTLPGQATNWLHPAGL